MSDTKVLKVSLGRDCVVIRPGYNGARHRDSWLRHDLGFGVIAWTYPDGELIEVQVPALVRDVETFAFDGWLPRTYENGSS